MLSTTRFLFSTSSSSIAQKTAAASSSVMASATMRCRQTSGFRWSGVGMMNNANAFCNISNSTFATAAIAGVCFAHGRTMFHATAALQQQKNPYKVLGVPQGASTATIKKAYRVMAMKYHPDAPGGSHERFQEIQTAYEQVKTGVYIPKDGGDGSNPVASRFGAFKYKTASKQNVTFDEFMKDLHSKDGGRQHQADDDQQQQQQQGAGEAGPDGAAGGADGTGGAGGAGGKPRFDKNDVRIQAWFRLLTLWAVVFLTLRFAMLLIFPIRVEKKAKPNPIARKAPPPPLQQNSSSTSASGSTRNAAASVQSTLNVH